MRITFISRGISKSKALEQHIEESLDRVKAYFGDIADCKVVYRQEGRLKVVEITIIRRGDVFRCEKSHEDIYAAANDAIDTLWGMIRKYKTKIDRIRRNRHESKYEQIEAINNGHDVDEDVLEDVHVKHKKVTPNTMSVEEAIAAMNLVGHSFYIFINQETDKVSVVYKRDNKKYGDDSYGVIEVDR